MDSKASRFSNDAVNANPINGRPRRSLSSSSPLSTMSNFLYYCISNPKNIHPSTSASKNPREDLTLAERFEEDGDWLLIQKDADSVSESSSCTEDKETSSTSRSSTPRLRVPQRTAVALYDFEAQLEDELSIAEDEKLAILEKEAGQEWWKVKKLNGGAEGLVPSSYIQEVEGFEEGESGNSRLSPVAELPSEEETVNSHCDISENQSRSMKSSYLINQSTLFNLKFDLWNEPSTIEKDKLEVFQEGSKKEWKEGQEGEQETGVEDSHREIENEERTNSIKSHTVSLPNPLTYQLPNNSTPRFIATAIYSYEAEWNDELSFQTNDKLEVMDRRDGMWWRVRRLHDGKEGIVPAPFLKLEEQSTVAETHAESPRPQTLPGENAEDLISSKIEDKTAELLQPTFRKWTDETGRFEVRAKFVEFVEGKFESVRLYKMNGVTVSVPLKKLSVGDVDYLAKLV